MEVIGCYFTNMLTGNYSKLYVTFLASLWYLIPSAIPKFLLPNQNQLLK